jgi:hypothetical protein
LKIGELEIGEMRISDLVIGEMGRNHWFTAIPSLRTFDHSTAELSPLSLPVASMNLVVIKPTTNRLSENNYFYETHIPIIPSPKQKQAVSL